MYDGVSLNSTSAQGRVDVTNGAARILQVTYTPGN